VLFIYAERRVKVATIKTTLQMYDSFTNSLNAVNRSLQITTQHMERLQTAARGDIRINMDATAALQSLAIIRNHIRGMGAGSVVNIVIDSSRIMSEITTMRNRIQGMFTTSIVNITFNANDAIAQARVVRLQILKQLRNIRASIRVELPVSLQAMFSNLQMLVLRLIRVVRQLRTSSGANAAQLQNALQRIAQLEEKINQLQEKLNRRLREGGRASSGMLDNLKGMVAAYLSLAAAKVAFEKIMGGAMEQQSYIDTFTSRAGIGLGDAIYNEITKQALKAGQDVSAALSGTMSFMSTTMDPQQLKELNMLSMRLAKLNPAEGLEGAAFSIKELMSGDYTSIVERFNVNRSMVRDGEARAAGQAGDVEGFIKGMDKLLNQQNLTQKAFDKMLDSPAAKWKKVLSTFEFNLSRSGMQALKAFEPVFDLINNGFQTGKFDQFFGSISTGMAMIGRVTATVTRFLIDNWNLVKNTLLVLGAVASAVAIGFMIDWIIAAWPIALIIAVLIGLLTLLNYLGVSTGEVVSYIIGFFFGLYTALMNIVALLWNIFASYAEFLINLFIDPVYAIKKLFYDLAVTFGDYIVNMLRSVEDFAGGFVKMILGAVNKALEGFNWFVKKSNELFGTEFKTVGSINTDNVHVVSDGMKSLMDQLVAPTSDKDVVNTTRMQQKNWNDSVQSGIGVGQDLSNSLSKFSPDSLAKPYSVPANKNIGNIGEVGKVGKIEDKVDISSEDLKTMRDLAEMKSIQNFVSLTPTVQVTTGDINQGADIDTIVRRIGQQLETEFVSTAQGVYT
jgi:hypothetical protein